MLFLILLFFIFGSAIGSFLNVVVDRTVRGEGLGGRSYCDWCHVKLTAVDLVPIFSFLVLGARCRRCHKKLSWQYPIVEGLSGLLFAVAFWNVVQMGLFSVYFLFYSLLLVTVLIVVAVVDFKYSLIPTTYIYGLSIVALFYNYLSLPSYDFVMRVMAGFLAAAFFILIIVITRGRGMGEGDIPLAFLIGLVLGPINGMLAFFLAFLSGAIVSIFLIIFRYKNIGQAVPFAPFLIFGFFAAFFWASPLVHWYLMLY